ncbi:MAG: parvulin-like peptidyl-prolyl isomerase [Thermoproteota archaeon]|jgi:parvulin-like peptidyl-prolyl isomerase
MRTYYRASHILLDELEDAQEVKEMLNDGADFGELAKEYSSCNSAKQGGDLGKFTSGSMVAEFERGLYNLSDGEVSEPIKSKFGFHLILKKAL